METLWKIQQSYMPIGDVTVHFALMQNEPKDQGCE
jgi:hypothetical protein